MAGVELNWGQERPQGNLLLQALQSYQAGRELAQQRRTDQALQTYATDPAAGITELAGIDPERAAKLQAVQQGQDERTRRIAVGGQLAGGDFAGAQQDALKAGDFDLAGAVQSMSEAQRAHAQQHLQDTAAFGLSLKAYPYEQRAAVLQASRADLIARGFKPEEVDGFDPTDQNIDAHVAQAVDFKTMLDRSKPMNIAPGGVVFDPISRKPLYEAPFAPHYVTVAPGSDLHVFGGAGSPASSGEGGAHGVDVASLVQGAVQDGAHLTSGYRSPAHNAAIGGAPGSHHTEGTPEHPGAYDLTPGPGQDLNGLASRFVQAGVPRSMVKVEHAGDQYSTGDHVHVTVPQNPAAVGGGGHTVIHGPPKAAEPERRLSAAEVEEAGLPPGTVAAVTNGRLRVISKPNVSAGAKPTEQQAKDQFGAKRMMGASQVINGLEGKGYDAGLQRLDPLPFTDKRSYDAAKGEWIDSLLRATTGAAVTKQEFAQADHTYFPQVGDSAQVRQQKAAMRARVERDLLSRAGPAAAGGPAVGTVQKGYRFNGGNPADPRSWTKVQ